MSLRVGLGASQADLDVQGEIDFDFFEESDCTNSKDDKPRIQDPPSTVEINESITDIHAHKLETSAIKSNSDATKSESVSRIEAGSCSTRSLNKPLIRVSCDEATGMIQKTTIETVIPTPYSYNDNKCEMISPSEIRRAKPALSPRLRNELLKDDVDISDDSSISSMSDSEESILSSVSADSFELNESDSMTDVSPLASPYKCFTPTASEKDDSVGFGSSGCVKETRKEGVKFIDDAAAKQCPKCETIDFHELVSAMNRLQMTQNVNRIHTSKCKSPILTQNAKCRKNLSFTNEEVRKIDNDNQVLLKKIMAQQNRSKSHNSISSVHVRASSAVTRQRQQRQIELENLALLKRLEAAKPTKCLSRSHLLHDYDQRSCGILSRASSRSSYPSSSQTSFRSSNHTSGRSSALSIKSSNSSVHSKLFRSQSSSDKM